MMKKILAVGSYIGVNWLIGSLYSEVMCTAIERKENLRDAIILIIEAFIGLGLLVVYVPIKTVKILDWFDDPDDASELEGRAE